MLIIASYFINLWDSGILQLLVMVFGGVGGATERECIGLVLDHVLLSGMSTFSSLCFLCPSQP